MNAGRIQESHFRELRDVGDLDVHLGEFGGLALQGHGQVEADAVLAVHVDDHAVGTGGAGAQAPLARGDDQLSALLGGQVVLQDVGQDGALGVVGHLAGHQLAVLPDRHEDVVRQGVAGTVVLLPDGGNRRIDVVQDLVGGLVLPLGAVGGAPGGGGAQDAGRVAQAGGGDLVEAAVDAAVQDLVEVQADALVQEGFRVAADLDHLFLLQAEKSLIRGSDTTTKMHPLEGARGCRGGALAVSSQIK